MHILIYIQLSKTKNTRTSSQTFLKQVKNSLQTYG